MDTLIFRGWCLLAFPLVAPARTGDVALISREVPRSYRVFEPRTGKVLSEGRLLETVPAQAYTGPDNDCWDHVNYIVRRANEFGLRIGFLPTWGDKWQKNGGKGPLVFNPDNAVHAGIVLPMCRSIRISGGGIDARARGS